MKTCIEFLGLPGSGKTTLARELCRYARCRGQRAFSADEALYAALQRRSRWYHLRRPVKYCSYARGRRWLYDVCAQPRFSYEPLNRFLDEYGGMAQTLEAIVRRPEQFQDSALLIRWLVRLFSGYGLVRELLRQDETLILDEGFSNRALSIFGYTAGSIDPARVRAYISSMPAPDAVICIEASAEIRLRRLKDRGFPTRLKNAGTQRRAELDRNFTACLAATVAALTDRGIPVFHINNDGPLDRCCRDMHDCASAIFHASCTCIP